MDSEEQLINQIVTTVQKIESLVNTLVDTINATLSIIPFFLSWIVDAVKAGINKFFDLMSQFWDWINGVIDQLGSPSAVTKAADDWSTNVGGPVSAEVGLADAGMLLVDDKWTGEAADLYKQVVPLQKTAIDRIKNGFTDGIALVLSQYRTAIVLFIGAVLVAIAVAATGIAGAVAAAVGIVTLPLSPPIAITTVVLLLVTVGAVSANLVSAAASADTQLRQKLNDNGGYPGGTWPPGVLH